MAIPITLTCECGQAHRADLGDQVTCSCGRVFDTSTLPRSDLIGVQTSQVRMRLYTTFGLCFVVGITVAATALWSMKGLMVCLPLSGLAWFRLVGPYFRRRVFRGAGELPRWQLDAAKVEPAEK